MAAPFSPVDAFRHQISTGLAGLLQATSPTGLYEPARFVLEGEGKRLRPVLVLLAAQTFGADAEEALPAALAVEVFHNFTLVHDDIMDRAETRRGRSTVHTRWDEPTAILCGDLLLGEAYRLLATLRRTDLSAVMASFSAMVARLCEGQTLDMAFEREDTVSVMAYRDMIARKTGALLETSLEIGGQIGGASGADLARLRAIGYHAGQAFQIQDDLLDLVAEDARWGKKVGGDLLEGKKTFLLLSALETARGDQHAWFARIVAQKGLPEAEIEEARSRMESLGVLDRARDTVQAETRAALDEIARLPENAGSAALESLVSGMAARMH